MKNEINLGEIIIDEEISQMLSIIQTISQEFEKRDVKIWFNGTFGVVGYYGRFFEKPNDIDCGVLEKDFEKSKKIIINLGFINVKNKKNLRFRVSIFKKGNIILELGTFDLDLGNNFTKIENVKYRIPDSKWLANCYKITAIKERRKGRNDAKRAEFLENYIVSPNHDKKYL